VFWLQLYNPDTGQLLRNVSSRVAQFRVSGVDFSTRVAAVITAVNRQGRSESLTLEGAVERAVGSRAANEPESTAVTMVTILAAPGGLLIAVVVLGAVVAIYRRQRKRTQRQLQLTENGAGGRQQPAPDAPQAPPIATAAHQQQREQLSLQQDDDYARRTNKQPDLIHPKRDHASSYQMDGNQQCREMGVAYMEATPTDDADNFFPTVRIVATGGRQPPHTTTDLSERQQKLNAEVHDALRNGNFIYR